MQGQSERLSENETVRHAYEYKWLQDALVPLKNPVGENITYEGQAGSEVTPQTDLRSWIGAHVTGSSCYGHTNLVPAFCRAYTEASGREVVAVHAAKGSTVIAQWLPDTDGYRMLKEKSAAAKPYRNAAALFYIGKRVFNIPAFYTLLLFGSLRPSHPEV